MLQRRSVLKYVTNVIFYISFQILPNCIKHREAVAAVFDKNNHENRENFLEAIKLFTEYNLQEHLQKVIFQGKQKNPYKKGRGKFVTI